MFLPRIKFFLFLALFFSFAVTTYAQSGRPTPTPTPVDDDKPETVFTEEIKLNVLAFDQTDNFAKGLTKQDLVIMEDGRLHQADSVRRVPANVLILLDVGNEISYAKRNKQTGAAAINLINSLHADDSIAVMQYGDKVDILSEWTSDKAALSTIIDKKIGWGKRSVFNQALDLAVKFLQKTPLENRHLILITDGVDTFNDQKIRELATRNLLSSDINVHVLSYTFLQKAALEGKTSIWQKGEPNPKRLPEEVVIALPPPQQQMARMPRLGSINLDREMIRKRKEEVEKLKNSETFLTTIAEDTNGEIFLPETFDEMSEKTVILAKNIDSQYVVTYTPKRALSESKDGEIRNIEVTSRREGVQIQGKRKFVVSAANNNK